MYDMLLECWVIVNAYIQDASTMLPRDKVVTRVDAEGVIAAEIRNQPELSTYPGGVAASIAAAARLNQSK